MAINTFLADMDATQDGSFFVGLNLGTGSTAAYDSAQAHVGTGSLKCVVTTSGQTASPYTPDNTVIDAGGCVSAWFRFSTVTPATLTNILMLLTSGNGSGRMGLGLNTNGTINFAQKGATSQANGSTTLSTNTWYRISLSYTNASTSTWAAKVYINGTLEINANAATQGNATAASIACISFGQNSSSLGSFSTPGVSTIWIDSMYADNRTDLTDCGAIDVTSKRPFSNGTTNGFTTQIGSGGSGYGSGHAPQINERPLSATNGWSMIGAGSAITEEYTIEDASVGDVDISSATIKYFRGWVYAKSLASETASIILAGSTSNISLTSTNTMFTKAVGSAIYPIGGTDIGIVTTTALTTVSLYECGILFAYIPVSGTAYTSSLTAGMSYVGAIPKQSMIPQFGLMSYSGSVQRSTDRILSATTQYSGNLNKFTSRSISANIQFVGSILKSYFHSLTASLSYFGSISKSTNFPFQASLLTSGSQNHFISRQILSSMSYTGSTVKLATRSLNASVSFAGSLIISRIHLLVMSASLSFGASISRITNRSISANSSYVGLVQKQVSRLNVASISFSGSMVKLVTKSLFGSASFTGNVSKLIKRSYLSSLSFVGGMNKSILRQLSGTLSLIGFIIAGTPIFIVLTATMSFSGLVSKKTSRSISGLLSYSGNISKLVSKIHTASISYIGSITSNLIHTGTAYTKSLVANMSYIGSSIKKTFRSSTAAVSFSGGMNKNIVRFYNSSVSYVGVINRFVKRTLSASISSAGVIIYGKIHFITLSASISFSGITTSIYHKFVKGYLSIVINTELNSPILNDSLSNSTLMSDSNQKVISQASIKTNMNSSTSGAILSSDSNNKTLD